MPDWFNDLNACHDRLTLLGIAVTETSIERLTESSQNRLTLLGIAVTETTSLLVFGLSRMPASRFLESR